jgi:hypothetical protein
MCTLGPRFPSTGYTRGIYYEKIDADQSLPLSYPQSRPLTLIPCLLILFSIYRKSITIQPAIHDLFNVQREEFVPSPGGCLEAIC